MKEKIGWALTILCTVTIIVSISTAFAVQNHTQHLQKLPLTRTIERSTSFGT